MGLLDSLIAGIKKTFGTPRRKRRRTTSRKRKAKSRILKSKRTKAGKPARRKRTATGRHKGTVTRRKRLMAIRRKRTVSKQRRPTRKRPLKKPKPRRRPAAQTKKRPGRTLVTTAALTQRPVGEITHYFNRIEVCVIRVTSGTIRVGDKIAIGTSTDYFIQDVRSLQIESEDVRTARRGQLVGMKVEQKVKPGQKVFPGI